MDFCKQTEKFITRKSVLLLSWKLNLQRVFMVKIVLILFYILRVRQKFCKNEESESRIRKNSSECPKAETEAEFYALLTLRPKSQKKHL